MYSCVFWHGWSVTVIRLTTYLGTSRNISKNSVVRLKGKNFSFHKRERRPFSKTLGSSSSPPRGEGGGTALVGEEKKSCKSVGGGKKKGGVYIFFSSSSSSSSSMGGFLFSNVVINFEDLKKRKNYIHTYVEPTTLVAPPRKNFFFFSFWGLTNFRFAICDFIFGKTKKQTRWNFRLKTREFDILIYACMYACFLSVCPHKTPLCWLPQKRAVRTDVDGRVCTGYDRIVAYDMYISTPHARFWTGSLAAHHFLLDFDVARDIRCSIGTAIGLAITDTMWVDRFLVREQQSWLYSS